MVASNLYLQQEAMGTSDGLVRCCQLGTQEQPSWQVEGQGGHLSLERSLSLYVLSLGTDQGLGAPGWLTWPLTRYPLP